MCDIIYFHPPRNHDENIFITIPVGIIGIINNLITNGYSVNGYNIPMELEIDKSFSINRVINELSPIFILIDLHWYEHSYGAINTAKDIKKHFPESIIIIGGLTASIYGLEIINNYESIDYVIAGEAEKPILELLDSLKQNNKKLLSNISGLIYRNNKTILSNDITYFRDNDIDEYNYTSINWLNNNTVYLKSNPSRINNKNSSFWLFIGAGCRFNCVYCGGSHDSIKKTWNRPKLSIRSYLKVFEDICFLVDHGVDVINPTQDLSILGKEYWLSLFQLIISSGIKPGLYNELFQCPSVDFLRAVSLTFDKNLTSLVYSPLTGNEEQRKLNGKTFSNKSLLNSLRECYLLGLHAELAFSENLPGTNNKYNDEKNILINMVEDVYPGIGVYSTKIALDPNSKMYLDPKKYGIKTTFKTFEEYYEYSSNEYTGKNDGYDLYTY